MALDKLHISYWTMDSCKSGQKLTPDLDDMFAGQAAMTRLADPWRSKMTVYALLPYHIHFKRTPIEKKPFL
jgi:hypothetical protein